MADDVTRDERPAAGWVLHASSAVLAIDALIERFGQLHRIPIAAGAAADLEPGQPCFFVRTDRSRVVGLCAVGEIVAPALALPAGTPLLPAEEPLATASAEAARTYAEVELLPIAKAVALDSLLADDALGRSSLALVARAATGPCEPLALTTSEVRALEAIEFWIDEPADEQRRALDRLLAAEDPILDRLEAPGG
jgi:hypothetical protein